jgi:integrase
MRKWENFTVGRVERFQCEPGKQQTIYWDGKTPGLGLRVTKGSKSFIFETALHGKTLRLTIGDCRTWTIGKAQEEATKLKALTDQGIDPRQVKVEQAESIAARRNVAIRATVTVAEAWSAYTEVRRHKWSARHLADHQNIAHAGGDAVDGRNRLSLAGALASLMPLKLSQIDATRVKAWLRDEATRRPTQAALAFRLLRAFLNWCADTPDYSGVASSDACQTRIAKDALPKKKAKTDCLQREQLPAWFAAVRNIQNPVICAYLQTLLLIGSRREELASLKWADVDFRWQAITIHDKVEGERVIPLTPYVADLLQGLKRRNDTPPPRHRILRGKTIENDLTNWTPPQWVFSSNTAESGRLQEPSIQHRKICAAAGIEGLTLHGLRRSFSTLTEWIECPVGVVAQIMGHKPSATAEKHYKVRPLDLLRMWHTKIEAWMLAQAGIAFESAQPGLRVVGAT